MSTYIDTTEDQILKRHPFTELHVLYVRYNWEYVRHWRGVDTTISRCIDWIFETRQVMNCHKDVHHEFGLKGDDNKFIDPSTNNVFTFRPGGFSIFDPINEETTDYTYPALKETFSPYALKRSTVVSKADGRTLTFWTMSNLNYGLVSAPDDLTHVNLVTLPAEEVDRRNLYLPASRIAKAFVMDNIGDVTTGKIHGEWVTGVLNQLYSEYGAVQDEKEFREAVVSVIDGYRHDSIHTIIEIAGSKITINEQDVIFPIPRVNPRLWKFEANIEAEYGEVPNDDSRSTEFNASRVLSVYTMPNSFVRIISENGDAYGDLEGRKIRERIKEMFKNV